MDHFFAHFCILGLFHKKKKKDSTAHNFSYSSWSGLGLLDGPAFCDPPGRAKKSLGPAGPGRVSGQIRMTENGLKKSDAATFLLDIAYLSQTYIAVMKTNIISSSFAWVKLNLLEEKIKLHLLFHFQVKKKLGQGGDWTWDPQIGTPSAIWPWPPRLCYILLKTSWVFCLKIRYFCDPGTRTLIPGSGPDWLTRVPGYTRVRGPTLVNLSIKFLIAKFLLIKTECTLYTVVVSTSFNLCCLHWKCKSRYIVVLCTCNSSRHGKSTTSEKVRLFLQNERCIIHHPRVWNVLHI